MALLLLLSAVSPRTALGQDHLPEAVVDDPCADADAYDDDDDSDQARAARRRCRLERFRKREAATVRPLSRAEWERQRAERQQIAADQNLPYRATRPLAVDAFAGIGIVSYGVAVSYLVAMPLEVGFYLGGAGSNYRNDYQMSSIAYTRLVFAVRARLLLLSTNLTPFLGAGVGQTQAPLNAYVPDPNAANSPIWTPPLQVSGSGRAHFVTAEVGLQYCHKGFRLALGYVFGYAFYTQANRDTENKEPDPALRLVWQESLDTDQHGVRFEVGYAF